MLLDAPLVCACGYEGRKLYNQLELLGGGRLKSALEFVQTDKKPCPRCGQVHLVRLWLELIGLCEHADSGQLVFRGRISNLGADQRWRNPVRLHYCDKCGAEIQLRYRSVVETGPPGTWPAPSATVKAL